MNLPLDKVAHAGAGGAAAALVTAALTPLIGPWWAAAIGVLVGALLGAGKELLDARTPGNRWDWADLAATVGGAVAAALVMLLMALGMQAWNGRTAPKPPAGTAAPTTPGVLEGGRGVTFRPDEGLSASFPRAVGSRCSPL